MITCLALTAVMSSAPCLGKVSKVPESRGPEAEKRKQHNLLDLPPIATIAVETTFPGIKRTYSVSLSDASPEHGSQPSRPN